MNRLQDIYRLCRVSFIVCIIVSLFVIIPSGILARESITVELITIEPGDFIGTRFGHIGLRVTDVEKDLDVFYHYGYAPFDNIKFAIAYATGRCNFMLAAHPWEKALNKYRDRNRTVIRQTLNLTSNQAIRLARHLEWEAKPENREYLYDQLLNNCSTRLRDLLDEISGGALKIAAQSYTPATTYRDYTLEFCAGCIEGQLFLDIMAGPNHDREVTAWDAMYLPLNLKKVIGRAYNKAVGERIPLAGPSVIENKRTGRPALTGHRNFCRFLTLFICLGAGIYFGSYRLMKQYLPGAGSRVACRATGLLLLLTGLFFGVLGAWILFLVIESSVADFGWNHNVFVFVPLDLIFVVTGFRWLFLGRTCILRPVKIYILLRLIVLAVVSVLKVSGIISIQDNWVFIAAVSIALLGMLLGLPGCRKEDRRTDRSP